MSDSSDTPTIHRITPDNPPQFPCWLWDGELKVWERVTCHIFQWLADTHWCQSETRPSNPPDAGHEADFVTSPERPTNQTLRRVVSDKSDTPRTDEEFAGYGRKSARFMPQLGEETHTPYVRADFARQLERELAAAHARAEAAERQLAEQKAATEQATRLYDATWQNATKWARENTELKQQVATLRKALKLAKKYFAGEAMPKKPCLVEAIEQALAATAPEEKP